MSAAAAAEARLVRLGTPAAGSHSAQRDRRANRTGAAAAVGAALGGRPGRTLTSGRPRRWLPGNLDCACSCRHPQTLVPEGIRFHRYQKSGGLVGIPRPVPGQVQATVRRPGAEGHVCCGLSDLAGVNPETLPPVPLWANPGLQESSTTGIWTDAVWRRAPAASRD